jgi:hypothetical protein
MYVCVNWSAVLSKLTHSPANQATAFAQFGADAEIVGLSNSFVRGG